MTLTPESGAQPYCAPAAFLRAYDARFVGQVVRDDETTATPAELLADPVLLWALGSASGEVETATMAGRRYGVADLAALDGNGRARLEKLVADLAIGILIRRRAVPSELPPQVREAEDALQHLRDGARVLPFRESADAGHAVSARMSPLQRAQANYLSDRLYRALGSRGRCGFDRPYPGR